MGLEDNAELFQQCLEQAEREWTALTKQKRPLTKWQIVDHWIEEAWKQYKKIPDNTPFTKDKRKGVKNAIENLNLARGLILSRSEFGKAAKVTRGVAIAKKYRAYLIMLM